MKFILILLIIALGVLFFEINTSWQHEKGLEACVASLNTELGAKSLEINQEKQNEQTMQQNEQNLRAQLELFNKFGQSDPRKISAAFSKTVLDREVDVVTELECVATWQCSEQDEPLYEGRSLTGRSHTEKTTVNYQLPIRKGMVLGERDSFVYVLIAISPQLDVTLSSTPKPAQTHTFGPIIKNVFYGITYDNPYNFDKLEMNLKFNVSNVLGQLIQTNWTVIHAWNHDANQNNSMPITLMVIGCQYDWKTNINIRKSNMNMLPYKGSGLGVDERTNLLYPVSQMNGCVSLIPKNFDWRYDRGGRMEHWSGFPESIHQVFLPIEDAQEPVLHSLIIQETESEALWIPVWSEKKHLDAPADSLDLAQFIQIKIQSDAGQPQHGMTWSDDFNRLKLLDSYKTLVNNDENR